MRCPNTKNTLLYIFFYISSHLVMYIVKKLMSKVKVTTCRQKVCSLLLHKGQLLLSPYSNSDRLSQWKRYLKHS